MNHELTQIYMNYNSHRAHRGHRDIEKSEARKSKYETNSKFQFFKCSKRIKFVAKHF